MSHPVDQAATRGRIGAFERSPAASPAPSRLRLLHSCLALLALGATLTAQAATGSLEGRWRLVEQRYGNGSANLAAEDHPVMLEIVGGPSGLSCDISAGEGLKQPIAWPAFVNDAGVVPVTASERSADLLAGALHARYSVRPSETEDLILDIEESYRISDDGKSLAGTMTVRFLQDGKDRGSYTLHRRFEREP